MRSSVPLPTESVTWTLLVPASGSLIDSGLPRYAVKASGWPVETIWALGTELTGAWLLPDIAVTVAEPPTLFALMVVIVAVELVPAVTPVTVTKPVLLSIATVPDAVAVPAHV